MAKIVYLSARKGTQLPFNVRDIERVFSRITPDNITPSPPHIIEAQGVLIGILNPVESLPISGYSVCMGAFFDHLENWWQPGSKIPDGSYALFRADEYTLELITDIVASRTIWYVLTDDWFIASTSQRMIVCFLRSYLANEAVIPWMLSSGTLGPGFSWDKRIHCLGGDTRLILDRRSWHMEVIRKSVVYSPLHLPVEEHQQRLQDAIAETFKYVDQCAGKWVLPLSGGYDSRAILLMMNNRSGLKTVTWGLQSAPTYRYSDAFVAQELAMQMGIENDYFCTDLANEPVEQILSRFIRVGEGRIDHISAYMDGFAVWKWLYEKGCQGVLRGDEAFGCLSVKNDQQLYKNMSLTILTDFANYNHKNFGSATMFQERPVDLEQKHEESREQWRDRVNAEFENPYVFAALSDLKLSYVEIIQPLLSRRIVELVRLLPDDLRTGKCLFKRIVRNMSPHLEFAKYPAIASRSDLFRDQPVFDVINKKLLQCDNQSESVRTLSLFCLEQLQMENQKRKKSDLNPVKAKIFRLIDKIFDRNKHLQLILDPYHFAFRLFLIAEMTDLLNKDANVLDSEKNFHCGFKKELTI
jgi:hypothetical protein